MEVRNAQYFDIYEGWKQITSAYVGPNGGTPTYEGSYDFGAIGDRFWMITSGVGGDWYGNRNRKTDNDSEPWIKNGDRPDICWGTQISGLFESALKNHSCNT